MDTGDAEADELWNSLPKQADLAGFKLQPIDFYKVIGTPRKELTIEAYKNAFCNLAIPFMTLSEPTAPSKTKCILKGKEWNWTSWDSLDMNMGDVTLAEFMD